MCQFEHEEKNIKLFPCPPNTEQAEQKHATTKKTNSLCKSFIHDVEEGAPFVIFTTREVNKEPSNLIPPKVTHDYGVY